MTMRSRSRLSKGLNIAVTNRQTALRLNRRRIEDAVRSVLAEKSLSGAISVAIVDDPTIAALNEQFLGHQGPTDVLSFVLEQGENSLEGEVVVSGPTAARAAIRVGWPAEHELVLYVLHGVLHLIGYDDATPGQRAVMRKQEREHLARLGIMPPVRAKSKVGKLG